MMPQNEFLYTLKVARLGMLTAGPTEAEARVVSEHFAYLKSLHESGQIILVGRTQTQDENTFGVVIFRATSKTEAMAMMESDPAIRQGVMQAKLYPYRVALIETRPGD